MTRHLRIDLDDEAIRAHLRRRASTEIRPTLTGDVLDALDRVPVAARSGRRRFGTATWRSAAGGVRRLPRLATGSAIAATLALVLVVAALPRAAGPDAAPRSFGGSYPADRPLTADELERVMTGPELRTLTTLVAQVALTGAPASCTAPSPYRVLGAVAGVPGPICVAGRSSDRPSSGILAFRTLGPRLLGYLAEVQPAASRLAYSAADAWPTGRPFLVDGWLGGFETAASCVSPGGTVDPLDPVAPSCPYQDWLADRSGHPDAGVQPQPDGSEPTSAAYDAFPSSPWARRVSAQGLYLFPPGSGIAARPPYPAESLTRPDESARGVYLVEGIARFCRSSTPPDRCTNWTVLARVDAISIPPPVAAVPVLTTAQLAGLAARSDVPLGATFVAKTTIDTRHDVCPMDRYPTQGVLAGVEPRVCVMVSNLAAQRSAATFQGTFAFRVIAPGWLGLLGEVVPASASRVPFRVTDAWPLQGRTFLVDAWLGSTPQVTASCTTTPPTAADPLDPLGSDCPYQDWLAAGPRSVASPEPLSTDQLALRGTTRFVEAAGFRVLAGLAADAAPVHGVFVVRSRTAGCPGAPVWDSRGCGVWQVLGSVSGVAAEGGSVSPATPATATSVPPSSPPRSDPRSDPVAGPTSGRTAGATESPVVTAPTGLLGAGGRALRVDELAAAMADAPDRLAGRIAIVEGPIPMAIECHEQAAAPPASPCAKLPNLNGTEDAAWAVAVEAGGRLSLVGRLARQDPVVQPLAAALDPAAKGYFVVEAWLDWTPSVACDTPPYPPESLCGAGAVAAVLRGPPDGELFASAGDVYVQRGAFQRFGSADLMAHPIHAIFLVQATARPEPDCGRIGDPAGAMTQCPPSVLAPAIQILSRLEAAA